MSNTKRLEKLQINPNSSLSNDEEIKNLNDVEIEGIKKELERNIEKEDFEELEKEYKNEYKQITQEQDEGFFDIQEQRLALSHNLNEYISGKLTNINTSLLTKEEKKIYDQIVINNNRGREIKTTAKKQELLERLKNPSTHWEVLFDKEIPEEYKEDLDRYIFMGSVKTGLLTLHKLENKINQAYLFTEGQKKEKIHNLRKITAQDLINQGLNIIYISNILDGSIFEMDIYIKSIESQFFEDYDDSIKEEEQNRLEEVKGKKKTKRKLKKRIKKNKKTEKKLKKELDIEERKKRKKKKIQKLIISGAIIGSIFNVDAQIIETIKNINGQDTIYTQFENAFDEKKEQKEETLDSLEEMLKTLRAQDNINYLNGIESNGALDHLIQQSSINTEFKPSGEQSTEKSYGNNTESGGNSYFEKYTVEGNMPSHIPWEEAVYNKYYPESNTWGFDQEITYINFPTVKMEKKDVNFNYQNIVYPNINTSRELTRIQVPIGYAVIGTSGGEVIIASNGETLIKNLSQNSEGDTFFVLEKLTDKQNQEYTRIKYGEPTPADLEVNINIESLKNTNPEIYSMLKTLKKGYEEGTINTIDAMNQIQAKISTKLKYSLAVDNYNKIIEISNIEGYTFLDGPLITGSGDCDEANGVCAHIARYIGIPTRIIDGQAGLSRSEDPNEELRNVNNLTAHGWSLYWDKENMGWSTADCTPTEINPNDGTQEALDSQEDLSPHDLANQNNRYRDGTLETENDRNISEPWQDTEPNLPVNSSNSSEYFKAKSEYNNFNEIFKIEGPIDPDTFWIMNFRTEIIEGAQWGIWVNRQRDIITSDLPMIEYHEKKIEDITVNVMDTEIVNSKLQQVPIPIGYQIKGVSNPGAKLVIDTYSGAHYIANLQQASSEVPVYWILEKIPQPENIAINEQINNIYPYEQAEFKIGEKIEEIYESLGIYKQIKEKKIEYLQGEINEEELIKYIEEELLAHVVLNLKNIEIDSGEDVFIKTYKTGEMTEEVYTYYIALFLKSMGVNNVILADGYGGTVENERMEIIEMIPFYEEGNDLPTYKLVYGSGDTLAYQKKTTALLYKDRNNNWIQKTPTPSKFHEDWYNYFVEKIDNPVDMKVQHILKSHFLNSNHIKNVTDPSPIIHKLISDGKLDLAVEVIKSRGIEYIEHHLPELFLIITSKFFIGTEINKYIKKRKKKKIRDKNREHFDKREEILENIIESESLQNSKDIKLVVLRESLEEIIRIKEYSKIDYLEREDKEWKQAIKWLLSRDKDSLKLEKFINYYTEKNNENLEKINDKFAEEKEYTLDQALIEIQKTLKEIMGEDIRRNEFIEIYFRIFRQNLTSEILSTQKLEEIIDNIGLEDLKKWGMEDKILTPEEVREAKISSTDTIEDPEYIKDSRGYYLVRNKEGKKIIYEIAICERLDYIFNHNGDNISIKDTDGEWVDFNEFANTFFKYSWSKYLQGIDAEEENNGSKYKDFQVLFGTHITKYLFPLYCNIIELKKEEEKMKNML